MKNKGRVKNPVPPGTHKYLYDGPPCPGLIPFILSLFLISLFWILPLQASAGTPTAVSGFAWSDTIGWIKFNPAFGGVQFDDATGVFSGYAWSENIGWIDFAPAGPHPAAPNYSACLDLPGVGQSCDGTGDYTVSGWARVVANGGGWDGWIKLKGTNYGVSLNTTPSPAEFRGYAWSDMVVGVISFNCSNDVIGGCEIPNDYKVTTGLVLNQPPLKPTTSETWDHCSIQELSIPTFSWTYSDPGGAPQGAAYQIKIYGGTTLDETVSSPSTSYTPTYVWIRNNLSWDTTYTWQVRVQDSPGAWSDWSDSRSFGMPKHAYPWIDSSSWVDPNPPAGFSWDPRNPGINETTTFTDLSIVYGGATKSSCSWDFEDAFPSSFPAGSCSTKPETKFLLLGEKTVTLTVTDLHGYICSGTKEVNARLPLPEWREIAPFSWANKLLAMVTNLFKNL